MEKTKKIKTFIGLSYLILVCLFLYFFFSKFSLQDLTSYDFIKQNRSYFFELKNSNLFLISIIFLLLTILWVFPFLGFGSPVALFGGFIFGKWIGTLIVVLGLSVGATFLYMFGNYFLKDFIREKFLNKYQSLEMKFKKSEFIYLLIYRFIGGIPFGVANVLPVLFNIGVKNYFIGTFMIIYLLNLKPNKRYILDNIVLEYRDPLFGLIILAAFIDPPPRPAFEGMFFLIINLYLSFNNFFLSRFSSKSVIVFFD